MRWLRQTYIIGFWLAAVSAIAFFMALIAFAQHRQLPMREVFAEIQKDIREPSAHKQLPRREVLVEKQKDIGGWSMGLTGGGGGVAPDQVGVSVPFAVVPAAPLLDATLTVLISGFTCLVSSVGAFSSMLLSWRLDRRQSRETALRLAQMQIELDKVRSHKTVDQS
jgi:hypothetical protein